MTDFSDIASNYQREESMSTLSEEMSSEQGKEFSSSKGMASAVLADSDISSPMQKLVRKRMALTHRHQLD